MINLPYLLKEGTIAFAGKVMANFRALQGAQNAAETRVENKIDKGKVGNSADVVFDDGDTLQEKMNCGALFLNAAMNARGGVHFHVDDTGHLKAVTNGNFDENDFAIDSAGHLIYTLNPEETESAENVYDLGLVKGAQGDAGARGPAGISSSFKLTLNMGTDAEPWDDATKQIRLTDVSRVSGCTLNAQMTEEKDFTFAPSASIAAQSRETLWQAWQEANIICVGQGVDETAGGYLILQALGEIPDTTIPIDVNIWSPNLTDSEG